MMIIVGVSCSDDDVSVGDAIRLSEYMCAYVSVCMQQGILTDKPQLQWKRATTKNSC